jgi:hypothetical protein
MRIYFSIISLFLVIAMLFTGCMSSPAPSTAPESLTAVTQSVITTPVSPVVVSPSPSAVTSVTPTSKTPPTQTQPAPQGGNSGTRPPKTDSGQTASQLDGTRPIPGSAPGITGKTIDQQVGVIQNSSQAFTGYTLLAPKHYTVTYLIDNAGNVANTWTSNYLPGQSVYLLENGHLLRSCFTRNQAFIGGGEGGGLEEYDWEGNLVWEFWYSSDQYLMHHDIKPLPNGNVLALAVEKKTLEQSTAAGFQASVLQEKYLYPDTVIEIKPTGPKSGEIVWEWHVWDHMIQDENASVSNYGNISAHPELIDVQSNGGRETVAFWNHMNSIDYNPGLDQILLSVRGSSEIWIIDHSTTKTEAAGHSGGKSGKGGDLLYRWGRSQAYGAGSTSSQQLFQQHDAQWIDPGLPGAGNILIFNNGLSRPAGLYSTVDEIVPPVDENGNYTLTSGSYGPTNILWTYKANPPSSLYSEAISGCQRLPNGNTLICDGTHGVITEVNSSGEIVWEYVNPVVATGPVTQGTPIPIDDRGHQLNAVFKLQRYAPDFPGFTGKTMASKGSLVK